MGINLIVLSVVFLGSAVLLAVAGILLWMRSGFKGATVVIVLLFPILPLVAKTQSMQNQQAALLLAIMMACWMLLAMVVSLLEFAPTQEMSTTRKSKNN